MDTVTLFLCLGLFIIGILVGTIVTLSVIHPFIGRGVLRAIAVITLGLTALLVIWPTVCMIRGERLRPVGLPLNFSIAEYGESYGTGGLTGVIGGMTLWLSFMGREKKPAPAPEPKPEEPVRVP